MHWIIIAVIVGCWLLGKFLERLEIGANVLKSSVADPISDDEFMRRCKPGTSREVALKVRRIVSDQLGIPYESVYPEHRLVEDLGAD